MVKVMKPKAIQGRTLGNKILKIISSGCFGNRWVFRFLFAGVPGNSASSGKGNLAFIILRGNQVEALADLPLV